MKRLLPDREKMDAEAGTIESGYTEWKRPKIEKGMAQSRDRAKMTSVECAWHDLNLER